MLIFSDPRRELSVLARSLPWCGGVSDVHSLTLIELVEAARRKQLVPHSLLFPGRAKKRKISRCFIYLTGTKCSRNNNNNREDAVAVKLAEFEETKKEMMRLIDIK